MPATKLKLLILLIVSFLMMIATAQSKGSKWVTSKPKNGEGVEKILLRYSLEPSTSNFNIFKTLNQGKIGKKGNLLKDVSYKLPIKIIKYNGKSIRSSVGKINKASAQQIQEYNEKILKKGLCSVSYTKSNVLWVPSQYLLSISEASPSNSSDDNGSSNNASDRKKSVKLSYIDKSLLRKKSENSGGVFPIFGKKYQQVDPIDNQLDGCIYYLVSGHGGPDPGAVGYIGNHCLCEDEYAYDVILRLGRVLLEHGATVYFVVQDPGDGIRDEQYLQCDENEKFYGDLPIPEAQRSRLQACTNVINSLYDKHKKDARLQQSINIHLDSRTTGKRIDIFFYHQNNNSEGKNLARTLYSTIKNKYDSTQPGRGYRGTISTRNLFMLRNTKPTTVYIELGNIQNQANQVRFIDKNNRQAIANWLSQGIINYAHSHTK